MIDVGAQSAAQKSLVNQATIGGMPQQILQAIKTAATKTGVDFSYLVNKASQESGFDPNAKASSSSATGLYQFTGQTWLDMVKKYGSQYGLSSYANQITVDSSGVARVGNSAAKSAILNLRKDPQISSLMAGELDKENMGSLQQNVTGTVGATELYLAHFLGAGGASEFLNEMKKNSKETAANVLPEAAAANPSVFYTTDGQPKTLGQIYQHFALKFDTSSSAVLVAAGSPNLPSSNASSSATYALASSSYASAMNTAYPAFSSAAVHTSGSDSLFNTMVLAQEDIGTTALQSLQDEENAFDRGSKKSDAQATTPVA